MKVKALILENFRAYNKRTVIPFSGLTGLIGRNDTGKSSILEALDIYFEGGTVKIEQKDASVDGVSNNVRIGVVFTNLPESLVLDSTAPTTLQDVFLLNKEKDLEVYKVFDCGKSKPTHEVYASALHPTNDIVKDILQKKQDDLKKVVKKLELYEQCDLTKNPSMRNAIYQSIEDLQLEICEVPLNKQNGKTIWDALKSYFPIIALFQSDRLSNAQDSEVQNPMKVAINQALSTLDSDLKKIFDDVYKHANETAKRTLAKIHEMHPGIASDLNPTFGDPQWGKAFSLDLETEKHIPLNKRGSGVRRLVLLGFFQAEADRLRDLNSQKVGSHRRVIYAIEEPETSQHPNIQQQIIHALIALAGEGEQVVLTTHVPALAGLMPLDSLRLVIRSAEDNSVKVVDHDSDGDIYKKIAKTLGVLPDAKPGVQVAVLVEGMNDIDALNSMIKVLEEAGVIEEWDDERIFWTSGGGIDTLLEWVTREYLDRLEVPQVMIIDSDIDNDGGEMEDKKKAWLSDMNSRKEVTAFATRKRCMDNYFHPDALKRISNGKIEWPENKDINYGEVSKIVPRCGKKYIARRVIAAMTKEELFERTKYIENGEEKHEVMDWVKAIQQHLE